jgi:eukaryotic-like serine/threonine-protein kinase
MRFPDRAMNHSPPPLIGKYRIEGEIGRGATSAVYLGWDPFNAARVAVKRVHAHLLQDERLAERYRRTLRNEALLAGKLRHPHIVRLLDADEHANPPYLVLEYVEGKTLAAYTAKDKLLPPAQVLDIAYKCCGALHQAQSVGLVHRDLKPANIMLQPDGNVKVTDFGTAMSLSGETTQMLGLMGSPYYMSPEQVREEPLTYKSDMFALGVVTYELLTGARPFEAESEFSVMYKIGTEDPTPPSVLRPDLPKELDQVVLRALAKKPEHRYAEWTDFADALVEAVRILPLRRPEDRDAERFVQMRALPFFAEFHDAALWEVLRLGRIRAHARGAMLMRENTPGDSFMILIDGEVAVSRNGWKLVTLEPGVTLGEMSYLQPERPLRTATAVAESDVTVLEVPNAALHAASDDLQKRFDKVFIRLLVQRLMDTTAKVGNWGMDSTLGLGLAPAAAAAAVAAPFQASAAARN